MSASIAANAPTFHSTESPITRASKREKRAGDPRLSRKFQQQPDYQGGLSVGCVDVLWQGGALRQDIVMRMMLPSLFRKAVVTFALR